MANRDVIIFGGYGGLPIGLTAGLLEHGINVLSVPERLVCTLEAQDEVLPFTVPTSREGFKPPAQDRDPRAVVWPAR